MTTSQKRAALHGLAVLGWLAALTLDIDEGRYVAAASAIAFHVSGEYVGGVLQPLR